MNDYARAYHFSLWLDERPVGAVHFVVEAAGVAEVVALVVSPPEGGGGHTTVQALPTVWRKEMYSFRIMRGII